MSTVQYGSIKGSIAAALTFVIAATQPWQLLAQTRQPAI